MTKRIFDKSKIEIPEGTMEDFNRPNHPDFMTSSELAKIEFTGIRHNSITNDCEFWILGNLEKKVTKEEVLMNGTAISRAWEEIFGLHEGSVLPDRRGES